MQHNMSAFCSRMDEAAAGTQVLNCKLMTRTSTSGDFRRTRVRHADAHYISPPFGHYDGDDQYKDEIMGYVL